MSDVTMLGEVTMSSSNGDGPALLAAMGRFVEEMSALGLAVGVTVTVKRGATLPAARALEEEAAAVQLDPTPAAPAAGAHQSDPATLVQRMAAGLLRLKHLSSKHQREVVAYVGAMMMMATGETPTMAEWDAQKPDWMPTAGALTHNSVHQMKWGAWGELMVRQYEIMEGTSSGG